MEATCEVDSISARSLAGRWVACPCEAGMPPAPGGTTEHAYYASGSWERMTLPNGVETTYTHDGLLRLERQEIDDCP